MKNQDYFLEEPKVGVFYVILKYAEYSSSFPRRKEKCANPKLVWISNKVLLPICRKIGEYTNTHTQK